MALRFVGRGNAPVCPSAEKRTGRRAERVERVDGREIYSVRELRCIMKAGRVVC